MLRLVAPASCLLLGLCLVGPLPAQDSLENLAEELVRLRGEVESLNAELTSLTDQHRSEMNSLASQKGDLEATERREELRIRQLEQDLADNRARAEEAGIAGESLLPVANKVLDDLESQVRSGLPFKVDERLQALAEIRSQLESGAVAPPRVINRLWSFYEDELRLTRENGLYSQIIELDGDRVLADVAKLGTVAMYFKTQDGDLGQAVRSGDRWFFEAIESSAGQRQVRELFDSLVKQIRAGHFELPNATIQLEPGA